LVLCPPLAVALGDPAGIGPEIVAWAWTRASCAELPPFFAIGDPASLSAGGFGAWQLITSPGEAAAVFPLALPVLAVQGAGAVTLGTPDPAGARVALDSLELGVGLAREGAAGALVTGPIAKANMYEIGFRYPGATEFVAERCGVARENIAMMLISETLITAPVTIHHALRDVFGVLTTELIVARGRVVAKALMRDFGIAAPRLAVAGLNPHAGEGGALGREELDIIAPAIEALRAEGIDARGPMPADTMFHARARTGYDAALCMYHDQALVPLKTLAFDEGVNFTAGLPIVRTAPDHGTAFDIAGRGLARPDAMIAAIRLAARCVAARVGANA